MKKKEGIKNLEKILRTVAKNMGGMNPLELYQFGIDIYGRENFCKYKTIIRQLSHGGGPPSMRLRLPPNEKLIYLGYSEVGKLPVVTKSRFFIQTKNNK